VGVFLAPAFLGLRLRRKRVSEDPVSCWTRDMKSSGSVWMTLGEYVWMMTGARYCTCGSGRGGFRMRCEPPHTLSAATLSFSGALGGLLRTPNRNVDGNLNPPFRTSPSPPPPQYAGDVGLIANSPIPLLPRPKKMKKTKNKKNKKKKKNSSTPSSLARSIVRGKQAGGEGVGHN
jgi:hypothetical protein